MKRRLLLGAILVIGVVIACVAQDQIESASASAVEAPMFEVDPFWPKPSAGSYGARIGHRGRG